MGTLSISRTPEYQTNLTRFQPICLKTNSFMKKNKFNPTNNIKYFKSQK